MQLTTIKQLIALPNRQAIADLLLPSQLLRQHRMIRKKDRGPTRKKGFIYLFKL